MNEKQFKPRRIPLSWKLKKISEVAKTGSGGTPLSSNKEYYEGGNIPWINSGEVGQSVIRATNNYITELGLKNSSAKIFPKGSVLVAMYGATAGRASLLEFDASTNQAICAIIPDKEYDAQFIKYYFDVLYNYLVGVSTGSARDNLNQNGIQDLEIPFPTLPTQKSIAKVLSDLDAKIELNNKINRELEAMAKTLYDYWFVQFDFPDEEGKPYKSSGGKMVYNAELKREIPEGWEVKNLFKSCIVQYGFPFSTEYFNSEENGVPVIRIRDILDNTISNYSTEKNLDEKYLIKKGDLLIGMDGNFHINYWSKNECYLNQRVVKLSETILPNIILKYQIEPYIKLREKSVSRTTVGHLSDKDLKALNLFIPSKEVLASVSPLFNKTLNRIIQTQNENQHLTTLRDWLLPMLMNGQVRVKEAALRQAQDEISMAAEPRVKYGKL